MKTHWALVSILAALFTGVAAGQDASSLRLVPFPKEVRVEPATFSLSQPLVLQVSADLPPAITDQIINEFKLVRLPPPTVLRLLNAGHALRLSPQAVSPAQKFFFRPNATPEDYCLRVWPNSVDLGAPGAPGLVYGAQTLRQLIRANLQGDRLPCVVIRDWPSLRWRAFQDDLTRGPSSTLAELQREAALGAFFKHNIFTYYMEYQYAFRNHPVIGPKDGSLTPEELKALAQFAEPLQLNILGNQQSFGHFTAILAHPEFAALRETPYLLCPTNDQTYKLLDDLYSEVAPLLPFPFFNVCCDETDGLGQGPSKPVAEKIGVGALYVRHIKRIHDLVTKKYQKRMMMWGDIILRHPDRLGEIPKDTVMLTWGYDPRPSFEDQIIPFAKSGYEFFVCPGVNCWNRVLPHFGAATANIRNFVRDGIKHGATGMLNTAWDDDGESFNAPNWHGFAWGAECAWNASATTPEAFNRRIGAVLFGEKEDHFGQAIQLLSTPGVDGLPSGSFWKIEFGPIKLTTVPTAREPWDKLLKPVRAAIEELEACRKRAITNAELLDFFVFGAWRIELYAQRELDRLDAALAYRDAIRAAPSQAGQMIARAEASLRHARDAHDALRQRFTELWARENKPYALDWTVQRYRKVLGRYDELLSRLAAARGNAESGRPLPPAKEVGLELVEGPGAK